MEFRRPNMSPKSNHQFKIDCLICSHIQISNYSFPLLYSTSLCTCAAVHWNLHVLVWSMRRNPPGTSCLVICYAYRWQTFYTTRVKQPKLVTRSKGCPFLLPNTCMTSTWDRQTFRRLQGLSGFPCSILFLCRSAHMTVLSGPSVSHPDTEV